MNTPAKFNRFAKSQNHTVKRFGEDYILKNISVIGRDRLRFCTAIFEHQSGDRYRLFEEDITEVAFPINQIKSVLKRHFDIIQITDPKSKKPSKDSERLYFVCRVRYHL